MKKQSKARKSLLAACAGIVASVTSVSAAVRNLPTPPPSGYVDRESSVAVALPTNEGRRVRITLVAPFAPTNAVMVAFGRDLNGDGDLAPEETEARVGVDCGVAVFSSESKSRVEVEVEERNLSTCSACQPELIHRPKVALRSKVARVVAGCPFHVFDLKQPRRGAYICSEQMYVKGRPDALRNWIPQGPGL